MKGRWSIQIGAVWAALLVTTVAPAQTASSSLPSLSPVILTENSDVVQRFAVDSASVRSMLDRSILKLTSARDIGTAWTRLGVTPQDVVGIKITTMGGPLLSSHRALIQAICDGLQQAGLPPSHIIVWDKFRDDMVRAGYIPVPTDGSHVAIASVFPGTGYDPTVFYKNELIGTLIWGDSNFINRGGFSDAARAVRNKAYGADDGIGSSDVDSFGLTDSGQTSNKSYFASLVTRTCTKIINVPVLTDNSYVGINGCLASLALGCVDNDRRFQGDPTYGNPAICEILSQDFLRRKVILHVLDSLVAQYAGGPRFNPQFTESIGALYVSRDPVAIDSLVLPRLERWRRQGHVDPIGKTAAHVHAAASYNLGTDDPGRIQLVRLP